MCQKFLVNFWHFSCPKHRQKRKANSKFLTSKRKRSAMLCKLFSQFLRKLLKIKRLFGYFRGAILVIYLMRLLYLFKLDWSNLSLNAITEPLVFVWLLLTAVRSEGNVFPSRTRMSIMVDKSNKYSKAPLKIWTESRL